MIGFYDYTVIATYGALFIALHGIYSSAAGNPAAGLLCLICCGVIDTFDGRIARSKKDRTADGRRFGISLVGIGQRCGCGVAHDQLRLPIRPSGRHTRITAISK